MTGNDAIFVECINRRVFRRPHHFCSGSTMERTDKTWYKTELKTLSKLVEKLKLDALTARQLMIELNEVNAAIESDCSLIELVILESRRDRSLRRYLDMYNSSK